VNKKVLRRKWTSEGEVGRCQILDPLFTKSLEDLNNSLSSMKMKFDALIKEVNHKRIFLEANKKELRGLYS
jgi:hypothetical protein